MGEALYKFLADKPVGKKELPALEKVKSISKGFLEQPALNYIWPANELLRRFNKPLSKKHPGFFPRFFGVIFESDYENVIQTRGVKPETIAKKLGKVVNGCEQFLENVKLPDQYISAYSSGATWDSSCAKDPEACAVIFVGIAPMLYAGLRSLKNSCIAQGYCHRSSGLTPINLRDVVKAVGYKDPGCRASMSDSEILKALKGMSYKMFITLYDLSGFWAFYGLEKAESVEAVEPVKPMTTAGAVEALKYHTSKNGSHIIAGDNSGVDMGLLHAWNAKKSNKPPKTGNALRSNNMYYPWLPTVSDLGNVIPI
ncbi:hypothetical protein, conserved [Babesia ovata]|uniref:Uncharacterized protein n=1 Tax=Babesia ovata TaxID=189622 RepID=A0A2H6K8L5_9APIC|nr:uncharacterized protein BOVATA_008110 [Babesia ovata]GBE59318.1 hypothetical protein, conserved [Babesia ovata]